MLDANDHGIQNLRRKLRDFGKNTFLDERLLEIHVKSSKIQKWIKFMYIQAAGKFHENCPCRFSEFCFFF